MPILSWISSSVYKIKKASYNSSDHSSSAHRKSYSNLKDIIKQKDDVIENEPEREDKRNPITLSHNNSEQLEKL